jgi:hypothetical protein
MEGTVQIVRGRFRRPIVPVLILLLAVPFVLRETALSGERYLIIEKPGALVIYDEYQRILGVKELVGLGSFVPMLVLSPKTLLGDGLTACMKVDNRGEPLYLLLENEGRLIGESRAGRIMRVEGLPLNDTVSVLRGNHLRFEPAGTSRFHLLSVGEHLIRIFQNGTRSYVLWDRVPPAFGWVILENGERNRSWGIVAAPPPAGPVITARIRDSIRSRLRHVNTVLLGLFTYFNRSTHVERQPPRWVMDSGTEAITCVLQNTTQPEAFGESTRALVKDFESTVLGSGLGVVSEPGKIVIRPK